MFRIRLWDAIFRKETQHPHSHSLFSFISFCNVFLVFVSVFCIFLFFEFFVVFFNMFPVIFFTELPICVLLTLCFLRTWWPSLASSSALDLQGYVSKSSILQFSSPNSLKNKILMLCMLCYVLSLVVLFLCSILCSSYSIFCKLCV